MSHAAHRVLLVDDDLRLTSRLGKLLRADGWNVDEAATGGAALERLRAERYSILLLDLRLPDMNGLEVLKIARAQQEPVAVVLISGYLDVNTTLAALQVGAAEILEKPVPYKRLASVLQGLIQAEHEFNAIPELVGSSALIRTLVDQILAVASYEVPVLIVGDTGTGKELVAQAIHRHSLREGPLVSINCAAVPDSLFEAELFGHRSGAFTGASSSRKGLLEQAGTGTVFLDEVGEMSQAHQSKLLRVLETRLFRPVGSNTLTPLRARVVSASNRRLARDSTFRPDLFHRLAGAVLGTPRLRDRMEDIELLATHLLARFAETHPRSATSISSAAIEALHAYHWPGNVRELKAVVESAAIHATTPELEVRSVAEAMRDRGCFSEPPPPPPPRSDSSGVQRIWDIPIMERDLILEAYDECERNLTRTAQRVNLPRSTLRDRLKRYGVL